jgi:hypothetical protein
LQLINPSTSLNELNTTLTPHSIIHGDACFAYFNKVWGIPPIIRKSRAKKKLVTALVVTPRCTGRGVTLIMDMTFSPLSPDAGLP